jgi:hypothetical protein
MGGARKALGSVEDLRLKRVAPAVVLRPVLHVMGRSEGRRPPNTEALNLPSGVLKERAEEVKE